VAANSGKRRTRTAFAVLGFLAKGPQSGYEIKQSIEEHAGHFWNESFGQIYPILKKLTEDALIEKIDTEATSKRSRQRYSITDLGLAELQAWINEPVEFSVIRSELLLKLFLGMHVDMGTNLLHIEDYKSTVLRNHKRLVKQKEVLVAELGEDSPEAVFKVATLDWGIEAAEMALAWVKKTKKKLEAVAAN